MDLTQYKSLFTDYLKQKTVFNGPQNLYDPINYILELGGKRMRPILVLMGVDAFGGETKLGLDAALAVEVFHNFTLLHDDIMDEAPLRRNQATVHEKWDQNTAILSGDAMMILSYEYLSSYPPELYTKLMKVFNKTALEVCEGQQYDMDFENLTAVSKASYIKMIGLKTSVLVGCALKMGAYIAGASESDAQALYDFGLNLGIAFQLQDDYLDVFGDPETFGKQVGGDIMENKKTFLYIDALQQNQSEVAEKINHYYSNAYAGSLPEKVAAVTALFEQSGAKQNIRQEIQNYTQKAFSVLEGVAIAEERKAALIAFGNYLMHRSV